LIYTGRMYEHTNLIPLLNVLPTKLTYIGRSPLDHANIDNLGEKTYDETIKMINSSKVCLIYSNNSTYQTYTKLYDYIGCKKPILLIWEDNNITHKSFLSILENYPYMIMAYNNEDSIRTALEELNNIKKIEIDTFQFSRNFSYKQFAE